MAKNTRLGRPREADSAETRRRLLDVARRCFAERGFEGTSNRSLATEAGLTTGAIYHYFDRKLDTFLAVHTHTQELVVEQFEEAIVGVDTLVDGLRAVLYAAHELNAEDPSLALFLSSSRIDASRDPVLAQALEEAATPRGLSIVDDLIAIGLRSGEIRKLEVPYYEAALTTVLIGLSDMQISGNLEVHKKAIDGVLAIFGTRSQPMVANTYSPRRERL